MGLRTVRTLLLLTIVAFAAWLRWPGVTYPVALHYDEGAMVRAVQCRFPPAGTHAHPFLNRYLLSLPQGIPCLAAWFRGAEQPRAQTAARFSVDPKPFLQWGRSVPFVSGLAAIVVVFLLGNAFAGRGVGLGAAFLLAVAPAHVVVSHNLTQWSLATLLAAVAFLLMKKYGDASASRRNLALMGAAVGVATASVYTLGLLVLPAAVVLVARWKGQGGSARPMADLAAVCGAAVGGHLLGNFTAFLKPVTLLQELTMPAASVLSGTGPPVTYLENVAWHFGALFERQGLGLIVASLGLVGTIVAVRRIGAIAWAFLIFVGAIFFIQPAAVVLFANRYVVPAFPVLVVAAAWLLIRIGAQIETRSSVLSRWKPGAALVVLAAVPNLLSSLDYREVLSLRTSREQAVEWVQANIPSGTRILQSIRFISPVIPDCRMVAAADLESFVGPCYDVVFAELGEPEVLLDAAANSGSEYLIYVQPAAERTLKRLGRSDVRGEMLRARYPLLARFHNGVLERFADDTAMVDPIIEIYRLVGSSTSN